MSDAYGDIAADLAPSGELRVSINLGNPVLAQGTGQDPSGVTVDIAREVARRLGRPVRFSCYDAARLSFEAMTSGRADLCFLAIEPAREHEVAFTPPYGVIEGVFVVRGESAMTTPDDVDRPGIRIGVKRGSAYDLFLTRTMTLAEIVRGDEGVDVFVEQDLEVGAGLRAPASQFVAERPELRLIPERFMEIRQAVGIPRSRRPETVRFVSEVIEELKRNGFVADALRRSGQTSATVAPPVDSPPGAGQEPGAPQ